MLQRYLSPEISISKLILVSAGIFTLLYNLAFFRNSYEVFAGEPGGLLFIFSLALFLFSVTVLVLSLLCYRSLTKAVLVVLVLGAAASNYFMNTYNIVIDTTMITNIMATDTGEAADLFNFALLFEFLVLGVLPAILIYRTNIICMTFPREVAQRLKLVSASLVLILCSIAPFTDFYTSFFREHKILRYYANPLTFIYSSGRYVDMILGASKLSVRDVIGWDAHIPAMDTERELIILVVGEAVRADHFGLNGYTRQTTPLLAQENVISYHNLYSCGTATAYSLPCMFSLARRENFDLEDARGEENLLDVLDHAGIHVLWRDNNSDSKGVAQNIPFEDFRTEATNTVCDTECRDVGMLEGLDTFINEQPEGDLVIVLHQMGNHGPAYFKRYPSEFEKFTPACQSRQIENCSEDELVNAYDNAILYTDYFLSQTISFLKKYDKDFQTAMYYMSDHGESLGENGLFLHGLPYFFAPDNQKHVASALWLGKNYQADRNAMTLLSDKPLSHDDFFHTVLGLMEVETELYEKELDLIIHPKPTKTVAPI